MIDAKTNKSFNSSINGNEHLLGNKITLFSKINDLESINNTLKEEVIY